MKTSRTTNSAMWIIVGVLALASCNTEEIQTKADKTIGNIEDNVENETNENDTKADTTIAAPDDFDRKGNANKAESLVLPKINCDTKAATQELNNQVRVLPTFDGVSPWPGLAGFWVRQTAGIYVQVSIQNSTQLNSDDGSSVKKITIKLKLRDLCTNKILAEGERSLTPSKRALTKINIALTKNSLKQAVNPSVVIQRIADKESQRPIEDMMGMTLQYNLKGNEKGARMNERILLRNVLNLTF